MSDYFKNAKTYSIDYILEEDDNDEINEYDYTYEVYTLDSSIFLGGEMCAHLNIQTFSSTFLYNSNSLEI
jgi:hypothetical protein